MISIMQIVVHFPLFNISYPTNVQYVNALLIEVLTFNVVNTDSMYKKMFQFTNDEPFKTNFDEMDIFE